MNGAIFLARNKESTLPFPTPLKLAPSLFCPSPPKPKAKRSTFPATQQASMSILALAFLFLVISSLISISSSQFCSTPSSFPSNPTFSACNDLPTLSSSLRWTFDAANATLSFAFTAPPAGDAGWVSWAINPTGEGMLGSQTLIAYRQDDGKMGVKTFNITDYAIRPSPIDFATADLAADFVGGVMRISGKMFLEKGTTVVNQVWQVGAAVSNRIPVRHEFSPANLNSKGKLDLIRRQSSVAPDSTTRNRNIHGILNAVSWGILLPIGAVIARYLKVFKSADPAWFYLHLSCQIVGYAVGVAGWGTGLSLGSKSKGVTYTTHRNIGITLFALGTLQVFALLLRPNKDHKYRFYWNIYHHTVGYAVIVLGILNVFKGLSILDPGNQWKLSYIIFLCAYGAMTLLLEVFTWIVVLRRKSQKSTKLFDGSNPVDASICLWTSCLSTDIVGPYLISLISLVSYKCSIKISTSNHQSIL